MARTGNVIVKGVPDTSRRLGRAFSRIKARTPEGLEKAADYLEMKTLTISPTTPKKTGHLRDSFFRYAVRDRTNRAVLTLGYSAPYAMWVHEMLGAVNWTEPGSGAKWLQIAMRREQKGMVRIVRETIIPTK